jgi:hypothetical protein
MAAAPNPAPEPPPEGEGRERKGFFATVKRWLKDMILRQTSTKR